MISPMAASIRRAERTPSPGSWTRNGTCLTHGSQVESRPSSASLSSAQRVKRLVEAQVLLDSQFLGERQIQRQPPFPLVDRKRHAWGWIDSVSVQHAVQTIRGLRARLSQSAAVRHQGTPFTHRLWWHPHGGNEIGRKPTSQFHRIT